MKFDLMFVEVQCEVPPLITNGQLLSKENLYYFQETVQFVCDHGYRINGVSSLLCGATGNWVDPYPTCQGKVYLIFVEYHMHA